MKIAVTVVFSDDSDASFRNGKSAFAVEVGRITNRLTLRNGNPLIDDRVFNHGVAADIDVAKQNRRLHMGETIDAAAVSKDRTYDGSAGNNTAGTDDTVHGTPTAVTTGKDKLRRRQIRMIGVNRSFRIVKI